MAIAFQKIRKAALSLPLQDQLRLANAILMTVGAKDEEQPGNEELAVVEPVLRDRLSEADEEITDFPGWTEGIRNRFDRKVDALANSVHHG